MWSNPQLAQGTVWIQTSTSLFEPLKSGEKGWERGPIPDPEGQRGTEGSLVARNVKSRYYEVGGQAKGRVLSLELQVEFKASMNLGEKKKGYCCLH